MYAWEQLQSKFEIPEDIKPSIAQRNAELYSMFTDIYCDFEESDFHQRSMWPPSLNRVEMISDESDEEADDEPEPKRGMSSSKLKGKSVDSDSRGSGTATTINALHGDTTLIRTKRRKCWRCRDPPPLWQMCDSPVDESVVLLGTFSATATPSPGSSTHSRRRQDNSCTKASGRPSEPTP